MHLPPSLLLPTPLLILLSTTLALPQIQIPIQQNHHQQQQPLLPPSSTATTTTPLAASYTIAAQAQAQSLQNILPPLPFLLQRPLHTTALLAGAASLETPVAGLGSEAVPVPVPARAKSEAKMREMSIEEAVGEGGEGDDEGEEEDRKGGREGNWWGQWWGRHALEI